MQAQKWEQHLLDWPESERLKAVVYLEVPKLEHCYTMPGIKSDVPLEDMLANKANELLQKTIVRPSVPPNQDGLRELIVVKFSGFQMLGNLRAAVNLTTKLLTDLGQGYGMAGQPSMNTFQTFELWACRFQLLMALKLYNLLSDELLAFEELDAPDLYIQYYPQAYGVDKGTLVPFSLRLVHAESLRFTPYPWAAIKRIDALEDNVRRVIEYEKENSSDEAIKAWELRLVAVQKLRARTLYFLKEYNLCMMLYSRIMSKEEDEEKKMSLRFLLARIAAIVGDERNFLHFLKNLSYDTNDKGTVYLHRALKSVFYGQYNKALETISSSGLQPEDARLWNNAAVCMLYSGRLSDALNIYEKCYDIPNEPLLVNLVSVNELTSRDLKQKKVSIFGENVEKLSDMFDPSMFKLSS
uniref:TPR_REGION domain-containing protein n=1 Tax=Syphacia muris TaxID=451379 RepID=A0A0N5A9F1_9BILA